MKKLLPCRLTLVPTVVTILLMAGGCQRPSDPGAGVPAPNRHEPERVEALVERARGAEADLVFLGDSITAQWETAGQRVWQRHYGHLRALNLGVGWEQTENVLWRLQQGHLDGLEPKLIVLLIGTNDSEHGKDGPQEIADGVEAIVRELRERLPGTKILLLGIFPRGRERDDPFRHNNEAANRLLVELADGSMVHYLDIGEVFLTEGGTTSPDLMPDYLHLNERGYELWAEAIREDVDGLLGQMP